VVCCGRKPCGGDTTCSLISIETGVATARIEQSQAEHQKLPTVAGA
jgi:hypothetical protein